LTIYTAGLRIEINKMTVFDVMLILAALFLSIGAIVQTKLFREPATVIGAQAVVYGDGKELQRIDLQKEGDIALPGGKMVLAVKNGTVRVKQSDCHRQTCVHAGPIGSTGETIVCVPNKMVIEIAGGVVPVVDAVVH
jgi:hypothetical protein